MELNTLAMTIVEKLKQRGADQAEVMLTNDRQVSISINHADVDRIEESRSKGMGLRIIKDHRLAFAATSDFSPTAIDRLIDELFDLVPFSEQDDCNMLPDASLAPPTFEDLAIFDPALDTIPVEQKIALAVRTEDAARKYDRRIVSFRRTGFINGSGDVYIANSKGINLQEKQSYCYIVCVPTAEEGDEKQIGSFFSAARFFHALKTPEEIGKTAAERAVGQLGAKAVKTTTVPVVFHPDIAASFIGNIASVMNGSSVYRNSSFLVGMQGKKIGSDLVTIIDDGRLIGHLGSSQFDGEGVATRRNVLFQQGYVSNYLYNTFYALKMKTNSTGNATRSYNSLPSIGTHNLYLQKGERHPDDIIAEVSDGLYLTSTMGSGLNRATGDFSYGATGYWISQGKLSFPVSSITIAGKMQDLLAGIDAVGNDLEPRNDTFSPTFRVKQLTISGT